LKSASLPHALKYAIKAKKRRKILFENKVPKALAPADIHPEQ